MKTYILFNEQFFNGFVKRFVVLLTLWKKYGKDEVTWKKKFKSNKEAHIFCSIKTKLLVLRLVKNNIIQGGAMLPNCTKLAKNMINYLIFIFSFYFSLSYTSTISN